MSLYATIVADPPWRFGSAATKADAGKHYETMALHDIMGLPVREWCAPDCHLWLWGINGLIDLVEQVSPGPYLEMFARRARMGDWHYWGDQSHETSGVAA